MKNSLSNEKFIIPEYKIDLFNKSKKIINSIENINSIFRNKKFKKNIKKKKKKKENLKKNKKKLKKSLSKKKLRTLWVRRKKKN